VVLDAGLIVKVGWARVVLALLVVLGPVDVGEDERDGQETSRSKSGAKFHGGRRFQHVYFLCGNVHDAMGVTIV